MKIQYLITKSNYGGAQKYTYELAVAAKAAGHSVQVACGGTGSADAETGELVRRLIEQDIPTTLIKHFMRDISWRKEVGAFWEIFSRLRKDRPDVLHISSSKAGGIGSLAGRLAGVQNIVFTVHGLPADESWRPRWQQALISTLTWITIKLSHKTIVLSSETKDRLMNHASIAHKIHLIHNGVAEAALLSGADARAQLGIPKNVPCIGGIGELHPNKNWFLAISALASLPDNTYFCLIGDGQERASLIQHAEKIGVDNRVIFAGHIQDAATMLSAFDILVLPSKKEGLPYVILEAGMAKLPVVATNLPGLQEIITTGEDGLLVTSSINDLTASLTMLLRDEGMRNRLGVALHSRVQQNFSMSEMIEQTLSLYSSINTSTERTVA
jgi:glycosyltransferase involved in cell wall biosynthesis